jgi:hypothetical protein
MYIDSKSSTRKSFKNLNILTKLKILKHPFKTNIISEDLEYLDRQREILNNLIYSFYKLSDHIENDNNFQFLDEKISLLDYMLKEDYIELNEENKEEQVAILNSILKNIIIVAKEKNDILDFIENYQLFLTSKVTQIEKEKLSIVETIIKYQQDHQTLILEILITIYLILIEFYFFITFQPQRTSNILTSGINGNVFEYLIKKGTNLRINAEIHINLTAGMRLDAKSKIMYGKSFRELTIGQKVNVSSPLSCFFNDNITIERKLQDEKLESLQKAITDLSSRQKDIEKQINLKKNQALLVNADTSSRNPIKSITAGNQELKQIIKEKKLLMQLEREERKKIEALSAHLLPKKSKGIEANGSDNVVD